MISKKYGKWNLHNPTEIDDLAYKLYLIEFDEKYLKGSPYLDQITFHQYYKNDEKYYKNAMKKIRLKKIKQLEKNKLSNISIIQ